MRGRRHATGRWDAGADVHLSRFQRKADDRPGAPVVFERPQLQEARDRHALVGALVLGRLVEDDLVRRAVEAEHQAKVLGRARAAIVVHADDRRHAARDVGVQRLEVAFQLGGGVGGPDLEPDRPAAKPERVDRAFQLRGVGAAPEPRVQPGAIEDRALVDVVAELAQRHRHARLAAEVGFLADMRHAGNPHRRGLIRRPHGARQQEHREPEPDATTETPHAPIRTNFRPRSRAVARLR